MPFPLECFFLNCPSEVLLLVARSLPAPDLAHLAQTNHAFYDLLIPVLWSLVCYKPSSSSSWYMNTQEIFHEEFLGLDISQRPAAYNKIGQVYGQLPSTFEALSTLSLPSGAHSLTSSDTGFSSLLSDEDDDNPSNFITHVTLPRGKPASNSIDKLSLALVQNQVSALAKASIKSLIISTDYKFEHQDHFSVPTAAAGSNSSSITLSFTKFLKRYLLTEETVPNLQYIRITHANPGHFNSPSKYSSATSNNSSTPLALSHARHCDYEKKRLAELASVLGNFLDQHTVRLSLDCAMLYPVQVILASSPAARQCLRFLHVDVLQTPSQHKALSELLGDLPNLEVLSVKTQEPKLHERFAFRSEGDSSANDTNDDDNDNDNDNGNDNDNDNDSDNGSMMINEDSLYKVDTNLLRSSCRNLLNLKTLILKATSLIEAFSPDLLPPSVTHLELDSNYNNDLNSHISSSQSYSSTEQFNNLWSHIFSHDLSQLTTLNIKLWNTELFSSLPPHFFALPRLPARILPYHAGNLQEIHIEGDYVPPGLDALIFSSNPHLKRVRIPIIYGPGAQALAQHCHATLEELTVFGIRNSFYHPPDFLDFRLVPLLARCRKLKSLYLHVSAKSLHGFDVLHLLAPSNGGGPFKDVPSPSNNIHNNRLNPNNNSSTNNHWGSTGVSSAPMGSLPLPPTLTRVIIEQSDFDLPHYKEVINEEEYDEFGGFGMLPLELIKQRLPLYNSIRTTFAPAEGDLSGIKECLSPIDGDESTHCDPEYKQYYSTVAYARYNCIFTLDIQKFLARNAFLFQV